MTYEEFEMKLNDYLLEKGRDTLFNEGVLRGNGALLTGESLRPLLQLMEAESINEFTSFDGSWFLKANGEFVNPGSDESRSGNISSLRKPGNVFRRQNKSLNPFFKSTPTTPEAPTVLNEIRKIKCDLLLITKQLEELESMLTG